MFLNYLSSSDDKPGPKQAPKEHNDHTRFRRRIRKTLYHASKTNKPSLSLTELTVDYMKSTAPRQFGKTDMYTASALLKDTFVPPCTLIVAMMYAQRLRNSSSQQTIDYLKDISSHDLLLVSMLIASKWLVDMGEDEFTSQQEWLEATNLESSDLFNLQMNFLDRIDWKVGVHKNEYMAFLLSVEKRIALRQWRMRKYATYTDLHILTCKPPDHASHVITQALVRFISDVFKITVSCSLAYLIFLSGVSLSIPLAYHLSTISHGPYITDSPLFTDDDKNSTVTLSEDDFSYAHHSTSHFERRNSVTSDHRYKDYKELSTVPFHKEPIYFSNAFPICLFI